MNGHFVHLYLSRWRPSEQLAVQAAADYAARCGLAPPQGPLLKTARGAPYWEAFDACLSISHSGGYLVCALAPSPVGVDLEEQTTRDCLGIARRFFAAEEQSLCRDATFFYDLWTAKEARAKRKGTGLTAAGLKKSCLLGDGFQPRFRHWRGLSGFSLCLDCAPELSARVFDDWKETGTWISGKKF